MYPVTAAYACTYYGRTAVTKLTADKSQAACSASSKSSNFSIEDLSHPSAVVCPWPLCCNSFDVLFHRAQTCDTYMREPHCAQNSEKRTHHSAQEDYDMNNTKDYVCDAAAARTPNGCASSLKGKLRRGSAVVVGKANVVQGSELGCCERIFAA
eukprot:SAG31_NODE_1589_length_7816_cov_5.732279_4_plen_154_part_00